MPSSDTPNVLNPQPPKQDHGQLQDLVRQSSGITAGAGTAQVQHDGQDQKLQPDQAKPSIEHLAGNPLNTGLHHRLIAWVHTHFPQLTDKQTSSYDNFGLGPYEAGLIGFCIGLLLSLLLVDLFLISDPVIEQICRTVTAASPN